MKRIIMLFVICYFIVSLNCPLAIAKEKVLPLVASASSIYEASAYYSPERAVDAYYSSCWKGSNTQASWWIMFDTKNITQIDRVSITWLNIAYTPLSYDIEIYDYSVNKWVALYTNLTNNNYSISKPIKKKTRFIRLNIKQMQTGYVPALRELAAYTTINVPKLIRFQGILTDSSGKALNGSFNLTFKIYDVASGGIALWTESQTNVAVTNGSLNVELGSKAPLTLLFNKQYWLGLTVAEDTEMTPRFKLTSTPYALRADE